MAKRKKKTTKRKTWNLYEHGVSPSLLNRFVECKEQFRLCYMEGWKCKVTNNYMEFGSIVHHVIEKSIKRLVAEPKAAFPTASKIGKWIADYEENEIGDRPIVGHEKLELTIAKAEVIAEEFIARYWKEDKKLKWLGAEVPINVPWKLRDGKLIYLKGRLDAEFLNENKELWLMDTKCKGRITEEIESDSFDCSLQYNLYMLARFLENKKPEGFCVNLIRIPGMYFKKDETYEEYQDRLREDIEKRPNHYFFRLECPYNWTEINKWCEEQLEPILEDLQQWFDYYVKYKEVPPNHYYNPNALFSDHRRNEYTNAILYNDYSLLERIDRK